MLIFVSSLSRLLGGKTQLIMSIFSILFSIMSLFSIFGGGKAPQYPTDIVQDKEGNEVKFTFFKHASFATQIGERHIYNDPVAEYAEY